LGPFFALVAKLAKAAKVVKVAGHSTSSFSQKLSIRQGSPSQPLLTFTDKIRMQFPVGAFPSFPEHE
jgi:hypothetical protein